LSENNPEKSESQKKPESLTPKTPPPSEYTTKRGRVFHLGRPALKHRKIVTKVLKAASAQSADYQGIIECAKKRGISIEQFVALEESELTPEELTKVLRAPLENVQWAEMMNDILTEALFATVRKAPFPFASIEQFEEGMDDYAEAVEMFPIAVKWISLSAKDMTGRPEDRKN